MLPISILQFKIKTNKLIKVINTEKHYSNLNCSVLYIILLQSL